MITAVSVPKEITSETLPPKGVPHALALHGRLSDRSPRAAGVYFLVGFEVAQHDEVPTWNEGDFFGEKFGPRHARDGSAAR